MRMFNHLSAHNHKSYQSQAHEFSRYLNVSTCAGYKAGAPEMEERWIMWLLPGRRGISGCSSRDGAEPTETSPVWRRLFTRQNE